MKNRGEILSIFQKNTNVKDGNVTKKLHVSRIFKSQILQIL